VAAGVAAGAGAGGIAAAVASATKGGEAPSAARAAEAATATAGASVPGAVGAASAQAHDAVEKIDKKGDLPGAAKDVATEKVEVAALGTEGGKRVEQAKGVEEKVEEKLSDADRAKRAAKDVAEEAGKTDDSADIEE
jgi:hypothetical protein